MLNRKAPNPRTLTLLGLLVAVNWANPRRQPDPLTDPEDTTWLWMQELRERDWRVAAVAVSIQEFKDDAAGSGYG